MSRKLQLNLTKNKAIKLSIIQLLTNLLSKATTYGSLSVVIDGDKLKSLKDNFLIIYFFSEKYAIKYSF